MNENWANRHPHRMLTDSRYADLHRAYVAAGYTLDAASDGAPGIAFRAAQADYARARAAFIDYRDLARH